jgi:exodeoxyribonuclease VII small subunit
MATNSKPAPNTDSARAEAPSFEDALGELEGIVAAMDAGKMPLQDALDAYQRGAALLRQCQDTLNAAEQQIRVLDTHGSGQGSGLRDFDTPRDIAPGNRDTESEQEG